MNLRSAGGSDPPWARARGADDVSVGLRGLARLRLEQRPRQRGRTVEEGLAPLRTGSRQRRLEQLPDDSEGELLLEVAATGLQHSESGILSHVRGGLQKRCLTDTRWATDNHDPACTVAGTSNRLLHPVQLGLALEQRVSPACLHQSVFSPGSASRGPSSAEVYRAREATHIRLEPVPPVVRGAGCPGSYKRGVRLRERLASVREVKALRRTHRDQPAGVDHRVSQVVVAADLVEVHGLRNSGPLV